jgi:hypothetical protein
LKFTVEMMATGNDSCSIPAPDSSFSKAKIAEASSTHLFMHRFLFAGLDQICHERCSFRNIFLDGLLGDDHSLWSGTNRIDPFSRRKTISSPALICNSLRNFDGGTNLPPECT